MPRYRVYAILARTYGTTYIEAENWLDAQAKTDLLEPDDFSQYEEYELEIVDIDLEYEEPTIIKEPPDDWDAGDEVG